MSNSPIVARTDRTVIRPVRHYAPRVRNVEPGDIVLSDLAQTPDDKRNRTPEEKLMLAVLENALNAIALRVRHSSRRRWGAQAGDWRKGLDADEDLRWLESRSRSRPFDFERICEHFGWHAETIREGVREWVARGCVRLRAVEAVEVESETGTAG